MFALGVAKWLLKILTSGLIYWLHIYRPRLRGFPPKEGTPVSPLYTAIPIRDHF